MTTERINQVALKVGAICIGNGGGQAGVELHKNGVETILINSSARDLDNTVVPQGVRSYIIEDSASLGRGAGRNREIAKKLYSEWDQSQKLMSGPEFVDFVSDKDVIFVIASTAGGTGSGIAPTIAFQLSSKYPSKNIILIGILPRLSESINSQQNAIQFFSEVELINKSKNIPYMVFDLEKYTEYNIEESYTMVAADIVGAVKTVRGDYAIMTKYGMIDERNMLTIISCKGMITAFSAEGIKMSEVSDNGIQKIITTRLAKSSVVNPQRDRLSKYFGICLEVDDNIDDPVKKADYSELFNALGEPFEIFVNYGITDQPTAKFGMLVSGQSMPYDRLNRCIERVNAYEDSIKERSYSIADNAKAFASYAKNPQVDKILGSANNVGNEEVEELPDFLTSSL